jgi:2,3-bisphosphoglycerate-independent phosphoglycerate mutase
VHSHINHLLALIEAAKKNDVPEVYVHFFGDGRDTAPRSATTYLKQLTDFMEKESQLKPFSIICGHFVYFVEVLTASGWLQNMENWQRS